MIYGFAEGYTVGNIEWSCNSQSLVHGVGVLESVSKSRTDVYGTDGHSNL